jgi:RNA polymerase sigma-70 factor (ECF subfamily)
MEIAVPQARIEVPQVLPFVDEEPGKPSLREVFEAEEGPLLRFAHGLTGRRETAEDLVQEAFMRLHTHWQDVAHPRAWLYRSVRNLALNHLRDHRRESDEEMPDTEDDRHGPDGHLARQEAAGAVRLLLSELREEDRTLLILKYQENLKYEQISDRTGLTVGNVGYKLHHLLKSLAENLRRLGIDSPEG